MNYFTSNNSDERYRSVSVRRRPNKFFFMFVLMLYPVMPVNFYVGPLSYANICGLLLVLAFFVFRLIKFDSHVFCEDWAFWQYLIVYAVFNFATASAMNGFAWVVSELLASIAIIFSIESKEDFFRAIDGIILAGVFLGMIGIAESVTGTYLIQGALMTGTDGSVGLRYGVFRCAGPFGTPINFGMYEAIAAVLATYRLTTEVGSSGRKALKISYLPLVISMALSVSRLAICVFVAAHAILLLSTGVKKTFSALIILTLLGCAVGVAVEIFGISTDALGSAFSDFFTSLTAMLSGENQSVSSGVVGFGNRFDLYKWVIDAVGGNWLTGLGVKAEFSFVLNEWVTKTSIEVNYLFIFFQCGVVGLISLLVFYIGNLRYAWSHRRCRIAGEGRFGFSGIALLLFVLYYIALFGVQETDLVRLHFELISLLIAYVALSSRELGAHHLEGREDPLNA